MAGVDITEDTAIYPVLAELSACLCTALGDGTPCFCGILLGPDIPAEYVGDDCEDACGAAYVRLVGAYPTDNFPEPVQFATCNMIMAYNVSVGVLRCASIGEEDGGPVDREQLEQQVLRGLSDMKAIRRAIQCCFQNAFPHVRVVMGTFIPLPQEGGVVGGEWPITIHEAY